MSQWNGSNQRQISSEMRCRSVLSPGVRVKAWQFSYHTPMDRVRWPCPCSRRTLWYSYATVVSAPPRPVFGRPPSNFPFHAWGDLFLDRHKSAAYADAWPGSAKHQAEATRDTARMIHRELLTCTKSTTVHCCRMGVLRTAADSTLWKPCRSPNNS